MNLIVILTLLVCSFLLALASMKDATAGKHVERVVKKANIKGSFVVFDDGSVKHYSSSSSSSSVSKSDK